MVVVLLVDLRRRSQAVLLAALGLVIDADQDFAEQADGDELRPHQHQNDAEQQQGPAADSTIGSFLPISAARPGNP